MDLQASREKIDAIDEKMLKLFSKRMQVVSEVAEYKKQNDLPILNSEREAQIINKAVANTDEPLKEYVKNFFSSLMEISRNYQENLMK